MQLEEAWRVLEMAERVRAAAEMVVRRRGECLPTNGALLVARWAAEGAPEVHTTALEALLPSRNCPYVVQKLEEAGYIERSRARDRRVRLARLTERGHELAREVQQAIEELPT